METRTNNNTSNMLASKQRKRGAAIGIENPFTFKKGQVFTGFGIGCGIGIGVGRPLNLRAIPMLGQAMSVTRGATYAFSGVGRHVNNFLRKVGVRNIEAGIGCGVGFGHGFGVGLALKPSFMHQVQLRLTTTVATMMTKFGMTSDTSFSQSMLNGMGIKNQLSAQDTMGSESTRVVNQPKQVLPEGRSLNGSSTHETFSEKGRTLDSPIGCQSRTGKVLGNFLQSPIFKEDNVEGDEVVGRLQSENQMLQTLLKHQQVIEELVEENEKLRLILVEDMKIPPSKLQLQPNYYSRRNRSPCTDCFECRRRQRKR